MPRNTQSARFMQIYESLPYTAQQALVENHLAPLLDVISPKLTKRILSATRRYQRKAANIPALDIRENEDLFNRLFNELEADSRRPILQDQEHTTRLQYQIVDSVTSWLNEVWSCAYEFRMEFARVHACLLTSARHVFELRSPSGSCKCSYNEMYIPLQIKSRKGRVVKSFSLDGAPNIERALLWIWRELFLTMLSTGVPRIIKHIPDMLDDIENSLSWTALERILNGGKDSPPQIEDGLDSDESDCTDAEEDSLYSGTSEGEHHKGSAHSDYARHWPQRIHDQVLPLHKLVYNHLSRLFAINPSCKLYRCLVNIAEDAGQAKQEQLAVVESLATSCAEALAAALEIHALNEDCPRMVALLDSHSALLRPRDAPALQCAAIALSNDPFHQTRATAILEQELRETALAFRSAIESAFPRMNDAGRRAEVLGILRMRNGGTARRDLVTSYVDSIAAPDAVGGHPMAVAAMLLGLPLPGGAGDEEDPLIMLDMDNDPEVDEIREEFRPRLQDRFNGWILASKSIVCGPAVLSEVYQDVVDWMPFLRGSDIVREMLSRLENRPNKRFVSEALQIFARFVKEFRKVIQAEKKSVQVQAGPSTTTALTSAPTDAGDHAWGTDGGGVLDDVD